MLENRRIDQCPKCRGLKLKENALCEPCSLSYERQKQDQLMNASKGQPDPAQGYEQPETSPLFEYHLDAYTSVYEKKDGIFLFLGGPDAKALINLARPDDPIVNKAVNQWLAWLKREDKRRKGTA
jgi:hypothetical protein